MHSGGGNASEDRKATDGTNPHARLHDWHAAANAIAGNQATGEVAQVRGDKGHPGKESDALQAEPACIAEILRKPKDVEPPNRVSERPPQNDSPQIPVAGKLGPSLRAAVGRNFGILLTGANECNLLLRYPWMAVDAMIDAQPDEQPHESQQPRGHKCRAPAERQCDHRNRKRSNGPAHTGAAIEDRYRKAR